MNLFTSQSLLPQKLHKRQTEGRGVLRTIIKPKNMTILYPQDTGIPNAPSLIRSFELPGALKYFVILATFETILFKMLACLLQGSPEVTCKLILIVTYTRSFRFPEINGSIRVRCPKLDS